MAFTVSALCSTAFGNMRVVYQRVTPDAAEGTVATGLSPVSFALISPQKEVSFIASGNTSQTNIQMVLNAGTTGTVITGSLGFSGCVAANVYHVVSFGHTV